MLNKNDSGANFDSAEESSKQQVPLWRQAFTLANNVRFTRTPDCEIIRNRAQRDPDYAARFYARLQARQDQPQPQQQVSQQGKENMSQAVALDLHTMDRQAALPADAHTPKGPTALISDFAFFEGGHFFSHEEQIISKDKQSVRNETKETSEVTTGSIIDLFRTLECRYPIAEVPALHLPPLSLEANAAFAPHYEMVQSISLTVSGLTTAQSQEIVRAQEIAGAQKEQDIDSLAREAIETESTLHEEIEDNGEIEIQLDHDEGEQREMAEEEPSHPVPEVVTPIKTPVVITPRSDSMLDPSLSLLRPAHLVEDYAYPSLDLLQMPVYKDGAVISQETLERSAGLLESVLEDFGIKGEIIHVRPGPVVTLYEFEPAPGVKSSRIIGLSDDIARSMSAISTRVAVIPGRNVIGIELPNAVRDTVFLRELVQSKSFCDSEFKLALALGKNIGGEPIIAELAKMPHLLVAGTTGSGKSVAINTMILSLLYRLKPDQCRLIMVDPKMLELSIYDGIPHLLTPVVTDPKKAVTALKWAVREMEERYRKMAKLGVRNIDGFNDRVKQAASRGESITCTVQAGFDKETGELLYAQEAMDLTPLPYIVIIVDEMADLMMVAGKEIEGAIQRLAQMARAAGIHLIMATQRPSVDVITGTIKANFPTRISFQVTSRIDSRTILGEHGAETLLGQGDMLHMAGGGRIVRVHGAFVSDEEVEHIVAHLKAQGKPDYLATVTDGEDEGEDEATADNIAEIVAASGEDSEELYVQAVKVVMRDKKCSTSYIQRRLGIGYNKAASLVERMEHEGLVGQANHVGKREILSQ